MNFTEQTTGARRAVQKTDQGSLARVRVRWLCPDYVDISAEDLCRNHSVMNMSFMWLAAT